MNKIKYTEEIHRRIVTAIKDGATQKAAARMVGVTPETLTAWKTRFRAFGEDVERAHAEAQVLAETSLFKLATKGNVRALQAWLEARRPEDWRLREPETLPPGNLEVEVKWGDEPWPDEVAATPSLPPKMPSEPDGNPNVEIVEVPYKLRNP